MDVNTEIEKKKIAEATAGTAPSKTFAIFARIRETLGNTCYTRPNTRPAEDRTRADEALSRRRGQGAAGRHTTRPTVVIETVFFQDMTSVAILLIVVMSISCLPWYTMKSSLTIAII